MGNFANMKDAFRSAIEEWEKAHAFPPEVHFKRFNLPPSGWEYISPNDHLQVSIYTTASTTGLTLAFRQLMPNGQVTYTIETLDGVSTSTLTRKIFRLSEGWLIGATISNLGGGLADQVCFVAMGLQQGFQATTAPHTILAQGYVSNLFTVDWPPVYVRGPAPIGNGDIYSSIVTLTAAQILALYATPVEIVPAPGTNKVANPFSVTLYAKFGTVAYAVTAGSNLQFAYEADLGAGSTIIPAGSVLGYSVDIVTSRLMTQGHSYTFAQAVNEGIALTLTTGPCTLGDGPMRVVTNYTIDQVA